MIDIEGDGFAPSWITHGAVGFGFLGTLLGLRYVEGVGSGNHLPGTILRMWELELRLLMYPFFEDFRNLPSIYICVCIYTIETCGLERTETLLDSNNRTNEHSQL